MFDANKIDIADELRDVIVHLDGYEDRIRIVLNKADSLGPEELMKVRDACSCACRVHGVCGVDEGPRCMLVRMPCAWRMHAVCTACACACACALAFGPFTPPTDVHRFTPPSPGPSLASSSRRKCDGSMSARFGRRRSSRHSCECSEHAMPCHATQAHMHMHTAMGMHMRTPCHAGAHAHAHGRGHGEAYARDAGVNSLSASPQP